MRLFNVGTVNVNDFQKILQNELWRFKNSKGRATNDGLCKSINNLASWYLDNIAVNKGTSGHATAMKNLLTNKSLKPHEIIKELERGMFSDQLSDASKKVNFKGNYANICRAIIAEARAHNLAEWKFSDELMNELELDSPGDSLKSQ
jgi:hypothetical protein